MDKLEITVRPANIGDAEAIWFVNQVSLGYDYSQSQTSARLAEILQNRSDRLWVAQTGQSVVGYIHGGHYTCTYADPLKNILALAVLPAYRENGVGRALLQALEVWAAEDGAMGVRLSSGSSRTEAHKFYQACGYVLRKEQMNFIKPCRT